VGARRARSLRDVRRRAYGQNFLASRAIAVQLVRQAKVGRGDLVLEIGAGNGILTAELARQARRVFAVEIDPVWVARLRERFAGSAFERGKLARLQNGTRQPSFR
jgi:23S rRNA (adenine-N6)-dimethyltransferase